MPEATFVTSDIKWGDLCTDAPDNLVPYAQGITGWTVTPVKWLVELSYPVYLLHLLPAMVISAILIGQGAGQIMVVLGTVGATFIINVIIYYVLIKFTPYAKH